MNEGETFVDYIKRLEEEGYIGERGEPLKCHHCDSTELQEDHAYEDSFLVEKDVTCKSCDKRVGYWSYGTWQV